MTALSRVAIVGGAGFIGSHFTDALLADPATERVTLYDNFTSGREWHYSHHLADDRLQVVRGQVNDSELLTTTLEGHTTVIHLASNPDIAAAMANPAIDFDEGTLLTHRVIEAVRSSGCGQILYASGSGIYGELGEVEAAEDHGPLLPVSTYGASKLAGEALICSYCYMFDVRGRAFRFGNVVGPRQTHGVGFDFLRKLMSNPNRLDVLGDGTQSKSYVHVDDVVRAVLGAAVTGDERFDAYNVATGDYITVREIAGIALDVLGLNPSEVDVVFGTADRGWKGDVPVIRLNTDKIQSIGWRCSRTSGEALAAAMRSMLDDAAAGRLW